MTKEIWKDVVGFEGFYQVSDLGRVKSFYKDPKGKIMNPSSYYQKYKKYKKVLLYLNKNITDFKVHRLVLLTFVGYSDLTVDHINGKPDDNRLTNLRYCTHLENNTIYAKRERKSGVRNITYHGKTKKYFFQISIKDRPRFGPLRKTIKEAAMDYYIMREFYSDYPNHFKNHPIQKLYPL